MAFNAELRTAFQQFVGRLEAQCRELVQGHPVWAPGRGRRLHAWLVAHCYVSYLSDMGVMFVEILLIGWHVCFLLVMGRKAGSVNIAFIDPAVNSTVRRCRWRTT